MKPCSAFDLPRSPTRPVGTCPAVRGCRAAVGTALSLRFARLRPHDGTCEGLWGQALRQWGGGLGSVPQGHGVEKAILSSETGQTEPTAETLQGALRRTRQSLCDTMQKRIKPAGPGTGMLCHCSCCPHVHPADRAGSRRSKTPLAGQRDSHQPTSSLRALAAPSPSNLAMLPVGRAPAPCLTFLNSSTSPGLPQTCFSA